jgi:hypothetical protein
MSRWDFSSNPVHLGALPGRMTSMKKLAMLVTLLFLMLTTLPLY